MNHDDLEHCRQRICEEELLARSASSVEVAERHLQMAMLYKAQVAVLLRSWQAVSELTA